MVDKKSDSPRFDNIKGLVQDLVEKLDHRMSELRRGTPFEGVRPSDAKTFMQASRKPRSIADLAKAQGISRQAAHKCVQRLMERGVVELQSSPHSNRDKIVHVTPAGDQARQLAALHLGRIEDEIEQEIGKRRLEELRKTLMLLVERDV